MDKLTQRKINYLRDSLILLKLAEADFIRFYDDGNKSAAQRVKRKLREHKKRLDKIFFELEVDSKRGREWSSPTTSYRRSIHGDKVLFGDVTVDRYGDPNYDSLLIADGIIEIMKILYDNFDVEFKCGFIGNPAYYAGTSSYTKSHTRGKSVDIMLKGYDSIQGQKALHECIKKHNGPACYSSAMPAYIHLTYGKGRLKVHEPGENWPNRYQTNSCFDKVSLRDKNLPNF